MKTKSELCAEYQVHLERISKLDYDYYRSENPSQTDRMEYAERQARVQELRDCFYREIARIHELDGRKPQVFEVKMTDRIMGNVVVSAPQCVLTHDLTNSLGIISGFSQLLSDVISDDPKQRRYLQCIRNATEKMAVRIREHRCKTQANALILPNRNDLAQS